MGFRVARNWPDSGADKTLKDDAVEALLTNHTLIVGQSRSGKTQAARRILEEVLLWTDARVVVLDPNADFRFLTQPDPKNHEVRTGTFRDSWKQVVAGIRVAGQRPRLPWGIAWGELSQEEMAAFLGLRPKDHFSDYRHLVRHIRYERNKRSPSKFRRMTLDEFVRSGYFEIAAGEELERYRLLLDELLGLRVWATSSETLDSLVTAGHRAVVVDLSMDDERVRLMAAARVLGALWRLGESTRTKRLTGRRATSTPWPGTVVLIDEAHMFAPSDTPEPQKQLLRERIERFADQGKKFNLVLMLVTQQPDKLHRRILSECGNRIVLRMNERLSLGVLEQIYGGLKGRYDGSLTFEPSRGYGLIEGAVLCDEIPPPPMPRPIQFYLSRTREGGATPAKTWARPKPSLP